MEGLGVQAAHHHRLSADSGAWRMAVGRLVGKSCQPDHN
jgi:hypothetical protein